MPEVSASNHWHQPDRLKGCILCGEAKPLSEFSAYPYTTRQGRRSVRYESRCKPCCVLRSSEYRALNPHMIAAQNARRDAVDLRTISHRYRQTEHGKAMKAKSQRLRKARMRSGAGDDAAIRAIYAEAMEVERIVAVCPVFDIPELGKKMHVDHIEPLSKGGKHTASNLQILPIGINMRKGARCQR